MPENGKPTIIFDEQGVCSGCRVQESKEAIDWGEREKAFREIVEEYKAMARESGNPYDCIIPISGGKDSTYQVYLATRVYGLNPLLVTYNHVFNTKLGLRNLRNLVNQFDCDLIRMTVKPKAARRISRYMLQKVGDATWHYHTGIFTFPFQIAVKYRIPLILWGEHGYSEMTGLVRLEDIPEFTKWTRDAYQMRGVKIDQILEDPGSGVTSEDVAAYRFPSDEEMMDVGVRGIYMGTYIRWDHIAIIKKMVAECNFRIATRKRERTFSLYHKLDDHCNDVHDYLKYLKFGYGRGTDHASAEIRGGRLTREEGARLAVEYDSRRPASLDYYLEYLGLTEAELEAAVEPMRDQQIWQKNSVSNWVVTDSIANHVNDDGVDKVRLPLVEAENQTFGANNIWLYWPDGAIGKHPKVSDQYIAEASDEDFVIL